MVDHGKFERVTRRRHGEAAAASCAQQRLTNWEIWRRSAATKFEEEFSLEDIVIPVDQRPMMEAHIDNFLKCMRTRENPHLDVETGARRSS